MLRKVAQAQHDRELTRQCSDKMFGAFDAVGPVRSRRFIRPNLCFNEVGCENTDAWKHRIVELLRQLAAAKVQAKITESQYAGRTDSKDHRLVKGLGLPAQITQVEVFDVRRLPRFNRRARTLLKNFIKFNILGSGQWIVYPTRCCRGRERNAADECSTLKAL